MRRFKIKDSIGPVALSIALLTMVSCTCSSGRVSTTIQASDWNVEVGPNPCDLTDNQGQSTLKQVVKVGKNKIHWHSKSNQPFYLVLHVPRECSLPLPFPQGSANKLPYPDAQGRWQYLIRGAADHPEHIYSDLVKEGACACDTQSSSQAQCETVDPNNPKAWQIKYDQYVFDKDLNEYLPCDGWIIIEK